MGLTWLGERHLALVQIRGAGTFAKPAIDHRSARAERLPERDRNDLVNIDGSKLLLKSGPGPQSLAFCLEGRDWPQLFERLRGRYGVWELARLEAIVRLADHRASEAAARRLAEAGTASPAATAWRA